jgi:hypothetical protein
MKGAYDQNNVQYRSRPDASTLGRVETYGEIAPINMMYSRQEFQPLFKDEHIVTDNTSHTNEEFKLGQSYNPPHGSNLGGYTAPRHQYNSYDLIDNDVTELFKKIDTMTSTKTSMRTNEKTLEQTHNNTVSKEDQIGLDRSVIPTKLTDPIEMNLLDSNIRGVKEHVVDHTIYINSNNRDVEQYPNPFNYRVDFNPVSGNTNAYISRLFKGVKYIDIRSVTVPRRYFISKYNVNATTTGTENNMIALFASVAVNANVTVPYQKKIGSFLQASSNVTYYFYYYEMNDGDVYYIIRYDLFLDNKCIQKVTIEIDGLNTKQALIDAYIAGAMPAGYTANAATNEGNANYWIIVDKQNTTAPYKIKFSPKNDVFEDIIDHVYEFTYTGAPGTYAYTANSYYEYVLSNTSLEDDRYLMMNIKELDSNYEYTTEQSINNTFSLLFPDYINGDYLYLDTSYQDKVFDKGILANITKLTISFRNSSNNEIKISSRTLIDYDVTSPQDRCICTYDGETGEKIRNYTCSHSYLRHPTYEKLQNTIMIKLGVVEAHQDVIEVQSV